MGCVFCATGLQGLRRQLTAGEIMRQAILARSWARDEGRELTHVVFMGMGEPLANYTHVSAAIERLTDADGFAMSPRRITVSTVGIPQNIRRLASDHPQVNLAVSLHAPDPKLRRELVPVPGASVEEILEAVREHNRLTSGRVTFEYVLLRGVNDSRGHARRLTERIRGLRAHVNLIPLNPSPGVVGERPSRRATLGFQQALQECGVPTTIRVEQGPRYRGGLRAVARRPDSQAEVAGYSSSASSSSPSAASASASSAAQLFRFLFLFGHARGEGGGDGDGAVGQGDDALRQLEIADQDGMAEVFQYGNVYFDHRGHRRRQGLEL